MIGGDRVHSTPFGLSHGRGSKTGSEFGIVNQLDDGIGKPARHSLPFTSEDHPGVTIPHVAGELRQIADDRNRSTRHRLERCDG